MLTKDFNLKLKGLEDDSGSFTGIASPYGEPADLVGDIVDRSAYAQSIQQQGKGYPLLFSHRADEPLGLAKIEDSKDGLVIHGQMLMTDQTAQRVHSHMKLGSLRGLSIGFTIPAGQDKVAYKDGTRILKEIRLHEISVVAVPAAPRAQITGVKALGDVHHMLKTLGTDVDDDQLTELLAIDSELRRLLIGRDPLAVKADTLNELKRFEAELRKIAA